jgi:hypothetical protein
MNEEKKCSSTQANAAAGGGIIWIIGWMFTIGFCKLSFGKALLGIVIWPYLLGSAVG